MVIEDIKKLFVYARESIKTRLENKEFKPIITKELKKEKGVFITLTINKQLRGCIGRIKPTPIASAVIETARNSAFDDYRFKPLTKEELKKVIIEISILTKPVKTTRKEIRKGHGVIIRKGLKKALFLPQVWTELPIKEEFLKELSNKAGLKPKEKGVTYEKFNVSAWKEKTPGGNFLQVY